MKIVILKAFKHSTSPRPFVPHEHVTVPDALAKEWIADGRAVAAPVPPVPPRRKREKAVKG